MKGKRSVPRSEELLDLCDKLADFSRLLCVQSFEQSMESWTKGERREPVSAIDVQIEKYWKQCIGETYPSHTILGEETGASVGESEFTWLLDPIDGTDDFLRGIATFGSIISILRHGVPIVGMIDHPVLDIRCKGAKKVGAYCNDRQLKIEGESHFAVDAIVLPSYEDIKKLTSSSLLTIDIATRFPNYRVFRNVYGHSSVLRGSMDACIEVCVQPHDIAATQVLILESGGAFSQSDFNGLVSDSGSVSAIFGRSNTVAEIDKILKRQNQELEQ